MKFAKMHGIGNDYVYINCFEEIVEEPSALSVWVSDRHFGVGSDGLILICPAEEADFEMRMYNADGSEAQMCGNGIRCVGKYVYDHHMTSSTEITVKTGAGIKKLHLEPKGGLVQSVCVEMGQPILEPERIPVILPEEEYESMYPGILVNTPIFAAGNDWHFTAVSMGNPHCIVEVNDPAMLDLDKCGPAFETHVYFPERINTEFICVEDPENIRMRVWERGSGETLACGTGACAAAVAANLLGKTKRSVQVQLLGGRLQIEWSEKDGHVYMTGPAKTVFEGELNDEWLHPDPKSLPFMPDKKRIYVV